MSSLTTLAPKTGTADADAGGATGGRRPGRPNTLSRGVVNTVLVLAAVYSLLPAASSTSGTWTCPATCPACSTPTTGSTCAGA